MATARRGRALRLPGHRWPAPVRVRHRTQDERGPHRRDRRDRRVALDPVAADGERAAERQRGHRPGRGHARKRREALDHPVEIGGRRRAPSRG